MSDESWGWMLAAGLLIAIVVFGLGYFIGQVSVKQDCEVLGAFTVNGKVYQCAEKGK